MIPTFSELIGNISIILRMIRPSDCDLKYHFGPKKLKYSRKKFYTLRFPQLVFVMNSPLSPKIMYLDLFKYGKIKF
jgi:hypothetical protein